jgi:hypothetical protein
MWFLVTGKRYLKNVRLWLIPCHSCKLMTNASLSDDDFSFHNQFWFLSAYLIELNPSIHSNQPYAFKITSENSSYTT